MQRGHQHLALADAGPDQAVHVAHLLREGGVVHHEVAELEVFVEAEGLGGGAQAIRAQLVGQLAEGHVAALGESLLQRHVAVGGAAAHADDAAALVLPGARAGEDLVEHAGIVVQRACQGHDLEHRAGGVETLQTAVQVGGVGHALLAVAGDGVGIVVGQGNHGQNLAGLVVGHAHRAPVAAGEGGGDGGLQLRVHGDLHAGANVPRVVEQLAQPVGEAGGEIQQRGGEEGLHARAGHARRVAHGLRKRPSGGGVLQIHALALLIGGGQHHAVAVGDVAAIRRAAGQPGIVHVRGPDVALGVHGHAVPRARADEQHHEQRADDAHVAPQLLHRRTSSCRAIFSMSRASSSAFMEEMPSRMPMEKKQLTSEEPP